MEDTSQSFEYIHPFGLNSYHAYPMQSICQSDFDILIFLTDVLMSRYVAQTYEDNGGYNGGVVDGGCYQVYIWGVGLHEVRYGRG